MRENTPSPIIEIDREHYSRAAVEQLIHAGFKRRYNATIGELPDRLMALFGADATPLAACGIRTAEAGFFSECYLDQPIERQVSVVCGLAIERERIVEITSLAGLDARSVRILILEVIESMERQGKSAAVFTTTLLLMRMIARMGVPVLHLHEVHRARVENAQDWGSYFEDQPAGYTVPSRATMRRAPRNRARDAMCGRLGHSGAMQRA